MNAREILITGCNGQLGRALRARHPGAVAVDVGELDITDAGAVDAFDWSGIRLVLNAAGYTDVNGAETAAGRATAWKVNARAVANLARVAIARDITLVHVSTDYVFDGTRAPYAEDADLVAAERLRGEQGGRRRRGRSRPPALSAAHQLGHRRREELRAHHARSGAAGRQPRRGLGPDRPPHVHRGTGARHRPPARRPRRVRNVQRQQRRPARLLGGFHARDLSPAGLPNTVADVTTAAYHAGARGPVAPRPLGSTLVLDKLEATGFAPRDWREALGDYLAVR